VFTTNVFIEPEGISPTPSSGPGVVLHLLRDGVPRTRAELATVTNVARSTVSARLGSLLEANLVVQEEGAFTGGRPASRFVFNPGARIVIAADLGATHAGLAVTDLGGTPLAQRRSPLDIAEGPVATLDWVVTQARELLKECGRSPKDLAGVGIGLPGPVEHSTGRPTNPPIMPGWDGYDVVARVRESFEVPVLVDNDVNLMALGEHGTAFPDVDHLLFVKVATGIGSGLISDGRLHRGAQGSAGDLGHVLAPRGGDRQCRCGNLGCLEAVASGAAVAEMLRAQGLDTYNSNDVVDLVKAGNMVAAKAVRQAGRDIGEVLAACVSMFNPSLIVIGGSLAQAGEMLLAGVREAVYGRSLPLATEHLRIVTSRTAGDAAVLGASTMVVRHALSPATIDAQLA
jgi:predicted NBD/HSP70 family sugar kinase